jgi:quercetin dioxygenase-like cupin family protein
MTNETTPGYTHVANLLKDQKIPPKGILSRTILNDDQVKIVLFSFAAGEELSEHTASMPATLQFLQGSARVTLGDDRVDATAGTWIHMEPNLKHGIRTETPVVMLLTLIKSKKGNA